MKAIADSCDALYDSVIEFQSKAEWQNLIDVQQIYPKAESVGNFTRYLNIQRKIDIG